MTDSELAEKWNTLHVKLQEIVGEMSELALEEFGCVDPIPEKSHSTIIQVLSRVPSSWVSAPMGDPSGIYLHSSSKVVRANSFTSRKIVEGTKNGDRWLTPGPTVFLTVGVETADK